MKKWFGIPAVMLLMLTTFTNCSPYSQTDNSSLDSLSLSCPNTSNKCVTPTYDNLSIKVNLPNNSNQILLTGFSDMTLGGECNEGGYPNNTIIWELYEGATKVRDSVGLGYNSTCVNGRFQIYFKLSKVATDNVDRTNGYNASGVKTSYSLLYRMRAIGSTGYADHPNAVKSISLLPNSI